MHTDALADCRGFRCAVTDYLEQELSPAQKLGFERHRDECRTCRAFVTQMRVTIEALRALGQAAPSKRVEPELLDLYRSWWKSETGGAPLADAAELLQELLGYSREQRLIPVRNRTRYRSSELSELILEEAWKLGVREPARALELAELGVIVCREAVEAAPVREPSDFDRLARALTVLGNARRICSDFLGAEEAFREAEAVFVNGSGSCLIKASLLQNRGHLLADCGQHSESVREIDEAITIYQKLGRDDLVGRTVICKASQLSGELDPRQGVSLLRYGLNLIDEEAEPRLALVAKHNLINLLSKCGCYREALHLIPETRELHSKLDNAVDLIRFRWLEGQIKYELGNLGEAESAFVEVRKYFVENLIPFDAALVSLDLALVYLKQARIVELKALASETVTVFHALGLRREAIAALAFLGRAREIEQKATVGLLRELRDALEKTRRAEDFRSNLSVPG